MSKQVMINAMPVRLGDNQHEFSVQLAEPGIVRAVTYTLEKKLIMRAGEASFDEVLTMFIEHVPNAPMRERKFVVVPTGRELGLKEGHKLNFVGTAVSQNTGQVAHIYEVKKATAASA